MDGLILQRIVDVFQIEGRGTVVNGELGPGWDQARPGDKIELQTPDGQLFKTSIKDLEIMRKGSWEAIPTRGILLSDKFISDQLPRGTKVMRIPDDIGA